MSKELNKAPVEQAGGDERDFQAKGAQEVPSPVSKEYDRHLISLLRKGEALPGHQEEAADEIERLRDWNDHLNNTVLPNILNPNFLMLMKGGERLLDLCTKDGEFIGVSLNDMKDVFDWMVTHARIAPDQAALAQPSQAIAAAPTYQFQSREIGESDWAPCDFRWYLYCSKSPEMDTRVVEVAAQPSPAQAEQAEAERPEVVTRVVHSNPVVLDQCAPLNANDEMMTVAQHAASVARWAEMFNRVEQERDAALARVASLESKLAELEKPKPAAPALAALPPFAEKVLAKLHRFYDCVSDFESGGVDIGRHWLDLLTQLGLLNRVQRSPALWEITQQGEDLLGTSQPSPAPELAERGTQHRFSTTEQTCRHDFAGVWWNDNGETKTGRECRHCGFFVADVTEAPAEQAEAERPEQPKRHTADVFYHNHFSTVQMEVVRASDFDEFAAQHERISAQLHDALDECDGGRWKLRSERDAALAEVERIKTISDNYYVLCVERQQQLDAALARCAELEGQSGIEFVYDSDELVAVPRGLLGAACHAIDKKRDAPRTIAKLREYARGLPAPVAQAQHSVPDELRAICMLVAETGIKYGRGRHRAVAADECRAVVNAVLNADLSVGRACEYAGCCDKAHPGTSLCIAHHSKKAREQLLAAAPGKEGV